MWLVLISDTIPLLASAFFYLYLVSEEYGRMLYILDGVVYWTVWTGTTGWGCLSVWMKLLTVTWTILPLIVLINFYLSYVWVIGISFYDYRSDFKIDFGLFVLLLLKFDIVWVVIAGFWTNFYAQPTFLPPFFFTYPLLLTYIFFEL